MWCAPQGYAFVEYATQGEALRAKESLEAQSRKQFQDMMATKNDLQRQRGMGRPQQQMQQQQQAAKPAAPEGEGQGQEGEKKEGEQDAVEKKEGEQAEGEKQEGGDTDMKDQAEGAEPAEAEKKDGAAEGAQVEAKEEEQKEEEAAGEEGKGKEGQEGGEQQQQEGGAADAAGKDQDKPIRSKIIRAEFTHIRRVQDLFSRNLYLASLPMVGWCVRGCSVPLVEATGGKKVLCPACHSVVRPERSVLRFCLAAFCCQGQFCLRSAEAHLECTPLPTGSLLAPFRAVLLRRRVPAPRVRRVRARQHGLHHAGAAGLLQGLRLRGVRAQRPRHSVSALRRWRHVPVDMGRSAALGR